MSTDNGDKNTIFWDTIKGRVTEHWKSYTDLFNRQKIVFRLIKSAIADQSIKLYAEENKDIMLMFKKCLPFAGLVSTYLAVEYVSYIGESTFKAYSYEAAVGIMLIAEWLKQRLGPRGVNALLNKKKDLNLFIFLPLMLVLSWWSWYAANEGTKVMHQKGTVDKRELRGDVMNRKGVDSINVIYDMQLDEARNNNAGDYYMEIVKQNNAMIKSDLATKANYYRGDFNYKLSLMHTKIKGEGIKLQQQAKQAQNDFYQEKKGKIEKFREGQLAMFNKKFSGIKGKMEKMSKDELPFKRWLSFSIEFFILLGIFYQKWFNIQVKDETEKMQPYDDPDKQAIEANQNLSSEAAMAVTQQDVREMDSRRRESEGVEQPPQRQNATSPIGFANSNSNVVNSASRFCNNCGKEMAAEMRRDARNCGDACRSNYNRKYGIENSAKSANDSLGDALSSLTS